MQSLYSLDDSVLGRIPRLLSIYLMMLVNLFYRFVYTLH
jgi:hypothetical protein